MVEELMGHGHVVPNPDGSVARCGGPRFCAECRREQAALGDGPLPLFYPSVMLTPEQLAALEKAPHGPLQWIPIGPQPLPAGSRVGLPAMCGLGCGRPLADTVADDGQPAPTVCARCQGARGVDRWGCVLDLPTMLRPVTVPPGTVVDQDAPLVVLSALDVGRKRHHELFSEAGWRSHTSMARSVVDLTTGLKWPKRRHREVGGRTVLIVIPKRIRLGLEQRPHPHIAWAEQQRRARAFRAELEAAGINPEDRPAVLSHIIEKTINARLAELVSRDNALLRLLNRRRGR